MYTPTLYLTWALDWAWVVKATPRRLCPLEWPGTHYTGCFTTCGHYCRRWFPRSLGSKKVHINMCPILDGYGVMTVWNSEEKVTII